ncbi:MAG: transcription repressor NadR [Christensenellales bacterium]|jgi:transcriptional regulator of NAD metabolism
MGSATRRKRLSERIAAANGPLTGAELSAELGVSRQVVVQDVALLRATGVNIVATPAGYILINPSDYQRPARVFTCRHNTLENARIELLIMVECGGKVRDVIIEHPIYGDLTGQLMLSTREAVETLITRLGQAGAAPLSTITEGFHMHTVEADTKDQLDQMETRLRQAGIIV